jgi:transposase
MFLREVVTGRREGNPVRYAQIVEAYRDEQGKPRHRILLSLGRVDRLDKEKIRRLVISLSRYLETGEVPEGGRIGQIRDFGVGYLAEARWSRLGLPVFFQKQLRRRKYEAPVERALFALVAHRMTDPGSKLACWDWLEQDAWVPKLQGLQLQHLYRAMDFLDDCHESLEEALYLHRRTLFDRVELVLYDTTSTYFECDEPGDEAFEYGLRQRGYSRDERPGCKQIVLGLAVDQQGLPICSDVYSGDTNDALTVVPMLERLRQLGLHRVVWVADRGMTSQANLSSAKQAGLHYIVGVRLRSDETLREAITADKTPLTEAQEGLQVKEVRLGDQRLVVCFSPESAERDLKLRTGAIDRMRPVLGRVNQGGDAAAISEHGLYRRFVSRREDGTYALDKHKLEREAQCDGTFVLEVSDPTMTAQQAALAYKRLLYVERSFRTLKHGVDIRPVYHRLDRRIRAHVSLCLLAYLLERMVELAAKMSFEQARKALRRLRIVELHFEEQRVWETNAVDPEARRILSALEIPLPPRVLTPA